jgi:hypothetical protein
MPETNLGRFEDSSEYLQGDSSQKKWAENG